jgi:flagellar motor switch protein FliN
MPIISLLHLPSAFLTINAPGHSHETHPVVVTSGAGGGTTTMPVHQVLRLGRGAIIELDASEDDEVQILANNLPVAKGTVIVSGNRIAVEVKEMLPRAPDRR